VKNGAGDVILGVRRQPAAHGFDCLFQKLDHRSIIKSSMGSAKEGTEVRAAAIVRLLFSPPRYH
jgi:hypothetical protein